MVVSSCATGINSLRNPDQVRVVGDAIAGGEIPILGVPKPRGMAIQKDKLRAAIVQIGVDGRPFPNGGLIFRIKKMNNAGWPPKILQFHPMFVSAGTVNEFIQAVMKKFGPIAAPGVAGTNPYGMSHIHCCIGTPGHFVIRRQPDCFGKQYIPTVRMY